MHSVRPFSFFRSRDRVRYALVALAVAVTMVASSALVSAQPAIASVAAAAPVASSSSQAATVEASPHLAQWRSILVALMQLLLGNRSAPFFEEDTVDAQSVREQEERLLAQLAEQRGALPAVLHDLHDKAIALHAEVRAEHSLAWQLVETPEFEALLAEISEVEEAINGATLDDEVEQLETWLVPALQQTNPDVAQAYQALQAEIAQQNEVYWSSPEGSQAEADSIAEMQRLDQEVSALLSDIYPEYASYQKLEAQIALADEQYLESDYGSEAEAAALVAKADAQRDVVVLLTPLVPAYAQYVELQLLSDEQSQIYAEAPVDSAEEANALERIEALAAEMDALVSVSFPGVMASSAELEEQRAALQSQLAEQIDLTFPALTAFQQIQNELSQLAGPDDAAQSARLKRWIASQLNAVDPEVAVLFAELEAELAEQDAIYWAAEYGSEEEANAQTRMAELQEQMNAVLVDAFPAYSQLLMLEAEIEELTLQLDQDQSNNLRLWLVDQLAEIDAEAAEEMNAIEAEAERQEAAYWDAEAGSEAEAEAEANLADLQEAAIALLVEHFPEYEAIATLQLEVEEQDAIYWAAEAGSAEEATAEERRDALSREASKLAAQVFPTYAVEAQQAQVAIDGLEDEISSLLADAFPGYSDFEEGQDQLAQWVQLFAELELVASEENAELLYRFE